MSTEKAKPEEYQARRRVGKQIKAFRQAHHLDQKPFAQKMGKAAGVISAWETGRSMPDLVSVAAIAHVLGPEIWGVIIRAIEGEPEPPATKQAETELTEALRAVHVIVNSNNDLVKTALKTNLAVFLQALKARRH